MSAASSSLWQRLGDAPGVFSEWDLRQRWEDHGFRWNLFHLTYLGGKLHGGNSGTVGRLSSSVDLILRVDGEAMVGWPGVDFLAHLKSTQGANINPLLGTRSQALDDADFTEWFWVDQLWMRQYFQGRKWAVQMGYLDQQTVLDRNAFANSEDRQFMAQYLDNNNAIIPLKVGLGANVRWYPNSRWDFSLGFADADNRILHVGSVSIGAGVFQESKSNAAPGGK
jgi:carbohydrate-selective porin OprB